MQNPCRRVTAARMSGVCFIFCYEEPEGNAL
jgi:hypothetical protein